VPAEPLRQRLYLWSLEVQALACVSEGVSDFFDDEQIVARLLVYESIAS
jgi:hypothetical protein